MIADFQNSKGSSATRLVAHVMTCFTILAASTAARAQIQNEPTEVITAPAPATFSDRAGLWPTDKLSDDLFTSDRTTLADRWNTIPGVQARETGSPTLSIRGSAQSGRVLELFDGIPLNMADGFGASTLLIPIEVMGDISLIKGPASTFYGNAAMAGAVDYRLKYFDRPTLSGSLGDAGGEFGDRHASIAVPIYARDSSHDSSQNPSQRKPVAQFSLLSERNPGNYLYQSTTSTLAGRRDHNSQDLQRATFATDNEFANGFAVSSRFVEAEARGESPGSIYYPSTSTYDSSGSLASVQLSKKFNDSTLASVRLTDTRIWGLYDDGTSYRTTSFVSRTSLYTDVNTQITDSILLRTYGDLIFDALTASYVDSSYYDEHDADLGQTWQFAILPNLSLQPAYRYQSRYGQLFKSFALVTTDDRLVTSFKFSEGFRAPSLTDRFAVYSGYIGNPSLQPEKSWTVELTSEIETGHRYDGFLEGFGAKTSVYQTKYTNYIDTFKQNGISTRINNGEGRSIGAEVSLAYGYKIWMLSGAYSYIDAKNLTTSEPLPLSPRHQASASVAQLLGPILLEAKETYWSSISDRDPTTSTLKDLPSWATFDFTMRTLALTHWEFRAGVLNLFDQARELTYGYPEPQRRFYASASRSF